MSTHHLLHRNATSKTLRLAAATLHQQTPPRRNHTTSAHGGAQAIKLSSQPKVREQHATCRAVVVPPAQTSLASCLAEEWAPGTWEQGKLHSTEEIIQQLTPKQLSSALCSCAKMNLKPSRDLLAVITQEVFRKLPLFRSQASTGCYEQTVHNDISHLTQTIFPAPDRSRDLSRTLGALSLLNHQPSTTWWQAFESQVYENLGSFSDSDLANLLWSFAALGHRNLSLIDHLLASKAEDLSRCSPDSLHLVIWSLEKLGYVPSLDWVQAFLDAVQPTLFQMTPAQMVDIVWALARLGVRVPTPWLDQFLTVAHWRFPNFNATLLSTLGWSVATLGHRPSQEWVLCFEDQMRQNFLSFSAHELACTAWALQRFGSQDQHNAVFCMLYSQQFFLDVDPEVLEHSKLMGQILQWWNVTGRGR